MTDEHEHHQHPIGDTLSQEADALIDPESAVEVPPPEQMSLLGRLRQPRTLLSIAVPLAVIVIAIFLNRQYLSDVPKDIGQADPRLIIAAFVVYYMGFPLRGWRWTKLLRGVGYRVKVKDGTEILFLSWLVNCIVPAKLGDLYRAYLLKLNSPVSATKTMGTVFMERIAYHPVHLCHGRDRCNSPDRGAGRHAQLRSAGDRLPAAAAQSC